MPTPKRQPKRRPAAGTRKRGQPSLMTEERIERICDAVRTGATRHHAALFAGIARSTLQDWLSRGHTGEQPYRDFLDKIEQAEGTLVVRLAAEITTDEHWQAKAWMLERKDPHYRKPPEQIEMSNPDGTLQPIGVALQMTPDAVRLIGELNRAELAAGPTR